MDEVCWPFSVIPSESQTSQHRAEIAFLEAAYDAGFRPYTFGAGSYGASSGDRYGLIIFRTRSFWELRIGPTEADGLAAYVGPFEVASDAVICWLRGGTLSDILDFVRPQLVPRGSWSSGYRLGGLTGVKADA